jgi:hypothetical protein
LPSSSKRPTPRADSRASTTISTAPASSHR